MTVASAPGKVVLSGEYAVLDGAPAVCVAVTRRAKARVSQFDGEWCRVRAPGFTTTEGRFVFDDGEFSWLAGATEFSLVEAVIAASGLESGSRLSLELDTQDFIEAGTKIGIGSSAALTVALLAALRNSTDVLDVACDAHRRLQKGVGSGIDIATAVHGGLIEFRGGEVMSLDWPEGLACRFVWTGTAASTQEKLRRLAAADRLDSRAELARAAAEVAAAWRSADAVLEAYPAYIDSLRRFSVDHGLGIFDAGHEALAQKASAAGLVYKPCGAGGGDVGVLLGRSGQALDAFIARDGRQLQCTMDPLGVELQ